MANSKVAGFKPETAADLVQMRNSWKRQPQASGRFNRKHEAGNAVGAWVVQAVQAIGPTYYVSNGSITCGTTDAGWCRLMYLHKPSNTWLPHQPDGNNVLIWVHNLSASTIIKGQYLLAVRILSGTAVVAEPYGQCIITPGGSGSGSGSGSDGSASGSQPPSGSGGSGSGSSGSGGSGGSGSGSGGSGGSGSGSAGSGSGGSGSGSGSGSGPSTSGGSGCDYTGSIAIDSTSIEDCTATSKTITIEVEAGKICSVSEGSETTTDLGDCCCGGGGSGGGSASEGSPVPSEGSL